MLRTVVLASKMAQASMRIGLKPCFIECKNTESFKLDAGVWTRGSQWLEDVYGDTATRADAMGYAPLVIVRRNRWPALAVFMGNALMLAACGDANTSMTIKGGLHAITFENFLRVTKPGT